MITLDYTIRFTRSESPVAPPPTAEYRSFERASEVIVEMARSAPAERGTYHKTYFEISFGGHRYRGRIDIERPEHDPEDGLDLLSHVSTHIDGLLAGRWFKLTDSERNTAEFWAKIFTCIGKWEVAQGHLKVFQERQAVLGAMELALSQIERGEVGIEA